MNVGINESRACTANARRAVLAGAALILAQLVVPAHAGPNEQAKRIYERIAGVPPSAQVLQQMAGIITTGCGANGCAAGDPTLVNAAAVATAPATAPTFYNVTLKNWVIPWTNRDQSVFAP